MSTEKNKELVPKRRFPEFQGEPGWESKRLGLALKFQAGFPFPSSGFNDVGKGLRLIRNRDLRSDDIIKFYSENFDSNFVVKNGDVLVGMDGDFTPTVWEKGEALLNQRVGRILPRGDAHHRFLLYILELCLKSIEEATARTTVKHLSHSAVEDRHEPLPSHDEQQKIADCLSSLDELIAAQARKVEALKTHKKGLMQQLFPREGETQPRLRFPDFRAANAWSVGKLGDIAENLDNRRVPITSGDREAGSIPYYGASGIVDYVKDFIFDEDLLCVSEDGANLVARTYPIAFPISGKAWVNNHAHVLKFEHSCTQKFVEIYLNSIKLDDFITGMAQPKLNKAMLDSIPIPHPDIREQQRIADCITALDELITSAQQMLKDLREHKQGLMQQLFPKLDPIDA